MTCRQAYVVYLVAGFKQCTRGGGEVGGAVTCTWEGGRGGRER